MHIKKKGIKKERKRKEIYMLIPFPKKDDPFYNYELE